MKKFILGLVAGFVLSLEFSQLIMLLTRTLSRSW